MAAGETEIEHLAVVMSVQNEQMMSAMKESLGTVTAWADQVTGQFDRVESSFASMSTKIGTSGTPLGMSRGDLSKLFDIDMSPLDAQLTTARNSLTSLSTSAKEAAATVRTVREGFDPMVEFTKDRGFDPMAAFANAGATEQRIALDPSQALAALEEIDEEARRVEQTMRDIGGGAMVDVNNQLEEAAKRSRTWWEVLTLKNRGEKGAAPSSPQGGVEGAAPSLPQGGVEDAVARGTGRSFSAMRMGFIAMQLTHVRSMEQGLGEVGRMAMYVGMTYGKMGMMAGLAGGVILEMLGQQIAKLNEVRDTADKVFVGVVTGGRGGFDAMQTAQVEVAKKGTETALKAGASEVGRSRAWMNPLDLDLSETERVSMSVRKEADKIAKEQERIRQVSQNPEMRRLQRMESEMRLGGEAANRADEAETRAAAAGEEGEAAQRTMMIYRAQREFMATGMSEREAHLHAVEVLENDIGRMRAAQDRIALADADKRLEKLELEARFSGQIGGGLALQRAQLARDLARRMGIDENDPRVQNRVARMEQAQQLQLAGEHEKNMRDVANQITQAAVEMALGADHARAWAYEQERIEKGVKPEKARQEAADMLERLRIQRLINAAKGAATARESAEQGLERARLGMQEGTEQAKLYAEAQKYVAEWGGTVVDALEKLGGMANATAADDAKAKTEILNKVRALEQEADRAGMAADAAARMQAVQDYANKTRRAGETAEEALARAFRETAEEMQKMEQAQLRIIAGGLDKKIRDLDDQLTIANTSLGLETRETQRLAEAQKIAAQTGRSVGEVFLLFGDRIDAIVDKQRQLVGIKLFEEMRDPVEKAGDSLVKYQEMLARGEISAETYARAVAKVAQSLQKTGDAGRAAAAGSAEAISMFRKFQEGTKTLSPAEQVQIIGISQRSRQEEIDRRQPPPAVAPPVPPAIAPPAPPEVVAFSAPIVANTGKTNEWLQKIFEAMRVGNTGTTVGNSAPNMEDAANAAEY